VPLPYRFQLGVINFSIAFQNLTALSILEEIILVFGGFICGTKETRLDQSRSEEEADSD
jgi:hypothetical protein